MDGLGLGPVGAPLNVSGSYLGEAAELEELGYSAIWLPGGQIDTLARLAEVIRATQTARAGSAIIAADVYSPDSVSRFWAQLEKTAPGRLVTGLGGPQQPRPLPALNRYLDQADRAEPPLPAQRRLLAAPGPRKLRLARDRCAGAILLLVTPDYIGAARQILGARPAPVIDQILVAGTDPARARQTARRPLRFLSGLPGYTAIFTRMGFTGTDIAELTDRLVDELIIWGDADTITARIRRQLAADIDHVILHVLTGDSQPGAAEVAQHLAGRLPSLAR
jgi:probable F420-dependent oxidoreductase